MSSAIYETFKAMSALWDDEEAGSNGLFFGIAEQVDNQGQKILPPFATINQTGGKVIPTMSSTLDDMTIQISCFSDRAQGATVAQDLADYATSVYHRTFLSLGGGYDSAGVIKTGTTIAYWLDQEKLWMATVSFRAVSG